MSLYEYRAEVVRVVDGDTLDLIIDLGFRTYVRDRVRLYGIDTPETYGVKKDSPEWNAGMAAKERLTELLQSDNDNVVKVLTHKDATGKYGRWLVEIFVDGPQGSVHVNELLVEEGHAKRYGGGKR